MRIRLTRVLVLASAALALGVASAPATQASTPIGADLSDFTGPVTNECSTAPFVRFQVGLPSGRERAGGTAGGTAYGVITAWRVRLASTQEVLPVSLMTVVQTSSTTYRVTGVSPQVDLAPPLVGVGTQQVSTRVPIEAGGLIALANRQTSGLNKCETVLDGVASCDAFSDVIVGQPAAVGATMTSFALPAGHNGCLMINADVEADADHDGFGDETQDLCPKDASIQAACPVAPAKAKKCKKKKKKRKSAAAAKKKRKRCGKKRK